MPFQKGHKGFGTKESYIKRGKKISIAKKGQRLSIKTRQKISNANKGRSVWNKGIQVDRKKYPKMGHFQKHTQQTRNKMKENHPHLREHQIGTWKGDNVQYRALHNWVEVRLGKPRYCKNCDRNNLKGLKSYHWANISGEYKRNVKDWIRLCSSCHKRFDIGRNWTIYRKFYLQMRKLSNE